jgi:hypothetical protein
MNRDLRHHLPPNTSTIAAENAPEWRGCGEVTGRIGLAVPDKAIRKDSDPVHLARSIRAPAWCRNAPLLGKDSVRVAQFWWVLSRA